MNILQKTIAEKAGVSYATVSRAFTNSAKVKPQTLQKFEMQCKNLEFQTMTMYCWARDLSQELYCWQLAIFLTTFILK